jgi:hypothetical protein
MQNSTAKDLKLKNLSEFIKSENNPFIKALPSRTKQKTIDSVAIVFGILIFLMYVSSKKIINKYETAVKPITFEFTESTISPIKRINSLGRYLSLW